MKISDHRNFSKFLSKSNFLSESLKNGEKIPHLNRLILRGKQKHLLTEQTRLLTGRPILNEANLILNEVVFIFAGP